MKKQSLMIIGGLIAALLCLAAFLFPIAPGVIRTTGDIVEYIRGYDFVFTNDAIMLEQTLEANGGMIAAFVLLIIGAVFAVFGLLLPLTGSTKFSGFLDVIAGLCFLATGIIFVLALQILGLSDANNYTWSLGYGFLVAGIAAALGGVIELVIGFAGMTGKQN